MFTILPFESPMSPEMTPGYKKLETTPLQKEQISALFHEIPAITAAETLNKAYVIKWHDGLPHELAKYKNYPGYMPVEMDKGTGQIKQWAELYPTATQTAMLYGFTAMSIASGQYFLAEINHRMNMLNKGIDKILEFLYGDKKAELLSEISFARYAYRNYASIVDHEEQCIATLLSLQEAKKTAIKDIEFYLADLYSAVYSKDDADIETLVSRAFQIRECLELSIQLYVTGNTLEVYYSQNYDPAYLKYVERDVSAYISKCEKQIIGIFNALRMAVEGFKPKLGKKVDKDSLLKKIDSAIDYLNGGEESELKKGFRRALYSSERASEYCITADGETFLKT